MVMRRNTVHLCFFLNLGFFFKVKEAEVFDKKRIKAQGLKGSRKRDKKSDSSVVFDSSPVCKKNMNFQITKIERDLSF